MLATLSNCFFTISFVLARLLPFKTAYTFVCPWLVGVTMPSLTEKKEELEKANSTSLFSTSFVERYSLRFTSSSSETTISSTLKTASGVLKVQAESTTPITSVSIVAKAKLNFFIHNLSR